MGPWGDGQRVPCVIICGGKGYRLKPYTQEIAKSMIPINGKPILYYILAYWGKYTSQFIFMLKHHKDSIIDYVERLPYKSFFVVEEEVKGIAHAILQAQPLSGERFIVVLGDCPCKGSFEFSSEMEQGIGVWETGDQEHIKRNYSVEILGSKVARVEEKPRRLVNNLCGMGVYFFNQKIFNYIRITKPSPLTNQVEITDVIQEMIEGGEIITPVFFHGNYINITFPQDLEKAERLFSGSNPSLTSHSKNV